MDRLRLATGARVAGLAACTGVGHSLFPPAKAC
jgi:hypothetical protein